MKNLGLIQYKRFNMRSLLSSLDMSVPGTINSTHGDTNCYYCSVAHLLRTDVKSLVNNTEIMQMKGGALLDEIEQLMHASDLNLQSSGFQLIGDIESYLDKVPSCYEFGFLFLRYDNTGHMITGERDCNGEFNFYDAQASREITHENIPKYLNDEKIHQFCLLVKIPDQMDYQ